MTGLVDGGDGHQVGRVGGIHRVSWERVMGERVFPFYFRKG